MNYSEVLINDLIPAAYNPRAIDADSLITLQVSLKKLGDLIPIIVNKDNNTIIAGHQRTKALKANGETIVKVFYVSGVNISDEIIFNQMHNFQDVESGCKGFIDDSNLPTGFQEVDINRFNIVQVNRGIGIEVNRILSKYGNVLTAVCCNGEIITGNIYVDTCKLLGINPNVYILPADKYELAQKYLLRRYGVFNYDSLKKESYVQGLAQPLRSIETVSGKRGNHSVLYKKYIFPRLNEIKGNKVLDFGAGKMVFAKRLAEFTEVSAIEFFIHNGKSIDCISANRLIDYFINSLETTGLFPFVINEFVINSVDSKEAEAAVMGCLNTFCKMGGTLFFGTRRLSNSVQGKGNNSSLKNAGKYGNAYCLDKNLFSATFRAGQWFYQHFHTDKSVVKLLNDFGFEIESLKKNPQQFFIVAKKVREVSDDVKRKSVEFEFNLPLPNDNSYNRHNDVLTVLQKIGVLK